MLHLLGSFIGSCGFSSLERRPEFWVLKEESEKGGLKLKIQETKIMASGPITSCQIDEEIMGNGDRIYFLGLPNHCRW